METSFVYYSFLVNMYLGVELLCFMVIMFNLKELSEFYEILRNIKELPGSLSPIFLHLAQRNIPFVFQQLQFDILIIVIWENTLKFQ